MCLWCRAGPGKVYMLGLKLQGFRIGWNERHSALCDALLSRHRVAHNIQISTWFGTFKNGVLRNCSNALFKWSSHISHHFTYRLYLLNPELKVDISWSVVGGLSMIHNISISAQCIVISHLSICTRLLMINNILTWHGTIKICVLHFLLIPADGTPSLECYVLELVM